MDCLYCQSNDCQICFISYGYVTVFMNDYNYNNLMLLLKDTYPKSHDMLTKLGSDSPLVQLIEYDNILISNGHLWKNQRKVYKYVRFMECNSLRFIARKSCFSSFDAYKNGVQRYFWSLFCHRKRKWYYFYCPKNERFYFGCPRPYSFRSVFYCSSL